MPPRTMHVLVPPLEVLVIVRRSHPTTVYVYNVRGCVCVYRCICVHVSVYIPMGAYICIGPKFTSTYMYVHVCAYIRV